MIRTLTALLALLALWVAAPAPASAAGRDKIIQDCADDGQLQGDYSPSELRDARKNLPSDIAEYTDCADVLRRAEIGEGGSAGAGGNAGGGGAGGGSAGGAGGGTSLDGGGGRETLTPANGAERAGLEKARTDGAAPVAVNGTPVRPGAAGFSRDATRNDMPTSLLFAIIALALLGLIGLAYAVRDRIADFGHMLPGRRA
jgi:hypothetical protein